MKVLAKDAKAGQWYQCASGAMWLCIKGRLMANESGCACSLLADAPMTHLPDCTGWDWQPPKPEKKYRPFANAAEFAPHRGRWIYFLDDRDDQILINSFTRGGVWHAGNFTDWVALFSQAKFDDDGTPFGMEVEQ